MPSLSSLDYQISLKTHLFVRIFEIEGVHGPSSEPVNPEEEPTTVGGLGSCAMAVVGYVQVEVVVVNLVDL